MALLQWFNGTHVVRVVEADTALGVKILVAEADSNGIPVSEFVPYAARQSQYYRDIAEVLAEGIKHLG